MTFRDPYPDNAAAHAPLRRTAPLPTCAHARTALPRHPPPADTMPSLVGRVLHLHLWRAPCAHRDGLPLPHPSHILGYWAYPWVPLSRLGGIGRMTPVRSFLSADARYTVPARQSRRGAILRGFPSAGLPPPLPPSAVILFQQEDLGQTSLSLFLSAMY